MLPFCGYNMGDYFAHWLEMGKGAATRASCRRSSTSTGSARTPTGFLWPGFGENSRVLIPSSSDPRALRLYALSGFALLPTFEVAGSLDRSALPQPRGEVHAVEHDDLESLAPISRDVRGAPHTPELEFALRMGMRLLRVGDRGFAVVAPGRGVWLLVARDDGAASQLLWAALAIAGTERPSVRWITAEQQWAIEIVVRAGLRLVPYGALCVRGQPGPLRAFLPSGPFA
jgi:hypothetical protein